MNPRPAAAAAALAVALFGSLWNVISDQPIRAAAPPVPPARRQLQCFAEGVLQHSESGAKVLFLLPREHADGGLINHRLRYVLLGRQVATNHDLVPAPMRPDYVASWMSPLPDGRVVWQGCGGVLVRR